MIWRPGFPTQVMPERWLARLASCSGPTMFGLAANEFEYDGIPNVILAGWQVWGCPISLKTMVKEQCGLESIGRHLFIWDWHLGSSSKARNTTFNHFGDPMPLKRLESLVLPLYQLQAPKAGTLRYANYFCRWFKTAIAVWTALMTL